MASVVSSAIVLENLQKDGRRVIVEQFVDDSGNVYQQSYAAESGYDASARLMADAAALQGVLQIAEILAEISANVAAVISLGSTAQVVFNFSTIAQNGGALLQAYIASSGAATIMIGDYLNAQTDDFILEGDPILTADQIAAFRTVWSNNASTAQAIRAATVV